MRQVAYRFLVLSWIALPAVAAAPAAIGGEPEWYAGIDVGSKGIKVIALPIDAEGKPDLHRLINKLPHEAVNNVALKDLKDGKIRRAAIEEARAAVGDFYRQLTQAGVPNGPKIKPENVWIVASSGLTMNRPINFDELKGALHEATGGAKEVREISQRNEIELLMRGAIPPEQWENAVFVDVGSGNVKCGYIHPKRGPHVERPYIIEAELEGTVAYRQTIEKELKKQNAGENFRRFCKIAEQRREKLAVDVAEEISRNPGLLSSERRRVYISGGSPYVIASLLHPVEMARDDVVEVRFTVKELHGFINALSGNEKIPHPSLAGLGEQDRALAEAKVREVMDLFEAKGLLAGAEILLGFTEALHWEQDKKELFFTKSGLVAWIVGFVAQAKAEAAQKAGQ
jgi:hypothetical protein